MVECFCLSMVEVQEIRLLAFLQFANSATFKGHSRQEKSSSQKYRTFRGEKPHKVLGGWSRQFSQ